MRAFLNGFYNFAWAIEDWYRLMNSNTGWKDFHKFRFYLSLSGYYDAFEEDN